MILGTNCVPWNLPESPKHHISRESRRPWHIFGSGWSALAPPVSLLPGDHHPREICGLNHQQTEKVWNHMYNHVQWCTITYIFKNYANILIHVCHQNPWFTLHPNYNHRKKNNKSSTSHYTKAPSAPPTHFWDYCTIQWFGGSGSELGLSIFQMVSQRLSRFPLKEKL